MTFTNGSMLRKRGKEAMSTGKYVCTPLQASKSLKEHSRRLTLKNPRSGENMKEKNPILCAVKILLTYYAADTENYEKINEKYYQKFTSNPIEALLSFTTQMAAAENLSYVGGYMSAISDFMYHQLSEIRKELSNTLPVAIEDKELSLLIFHGVVDGLMSFMRGSKQSRMDWYTTPDIVPKCGTSGE